MRFSPGCCHCIPVCECEFVANPVCPFSKDVTKYTISVAGLTNDDCTNCADWNGDFELCWVDINVWESAASASTNCGHTSGDPLWRLTGALSTGAGNYFTLVAVGLGHSWRIAASSWVCAAENILSNAGVVIVPNPCSGLPATITLTPCQQPCEFCDAEPPATMSVEISGIENHPLFPDYGCAYCDSFNAVYVLDRLSPCTWFVDGELDCSYYFADPIKYSVRLDLLGVIGLSPITIQITFRIESGLNSFNYWTWTKSVSGTTLDCEAEYDMEEPSSYWGYDDICAVGSPTCVLN